ncbi:hypothetical protein PR048_024335 [Dryococelus australis]|uniref:Uncharacterized protein n=1 Tax=Dryococelus australis TaxID=614101 RepID=A0ABQ9GNE2_9NEOP|nr:hypothetical protein PR048_024335 [Dryococelus australis]
MKILEAAVVNSSTKKYMFCRWNIHSMSSCPARNSECHSCGKREGHIEINEIPAEALIDIRSTESYISEEMVRKKKKKKTKLIAIFLMVRISLVTKHKTLSYASFVFRHPFKLQCTKPTFQCTTFVFGGLKHSLKICGLSCA